MSNVPLPDPLYEGNSVTTSVQFYQPVVGQPPRNWPLVDPTTIEMTFIAGTGAEPVTWEYLVTGNIIRVDEGVYSAQLSTTGAGPWSVKWVGSGACAAVSVQSFTVTPVPF